MSMLEIQRDMLRGIAEPFSHKLHEKVFAYEEGTFRGSGRRINRFMVGADPEFMLLHPVGDEPYHAASAGLRPALAFGSDQNERLVELRPAASRSTFEVTASILAELRWMYRIVGVARECSWRSGAFVHGDGMGGHVHFGRKRDTRAIEVRGLDGLAKTIRRLPLLPNGEWQRRTEGDQFNQRYGTYSDIRPQNHGYEYRTLPSWLDSPKLAFLVMTLAKLVVVDPELTSSWTMSTRENAWNLLRGLAKRYKGRDDDAWLLFTMMKDVADWTHKGKDFKERWGLVGKPETMCEGYVYPDCIPASKGDLSDLEAHFIHGKMLTLREDAPTFRYELPKGYRWYLPSIRCGRRPGVGELTFDWVIHKDCPVTTVFDNELELALYVPRTYKGLAELHKRFPELSVSFSEDNYSFIFYVNRGWRTGMKLRRTREIIASGLLPIFNVNTVEAGNFERWTAQYLESNKNQGVLERLAEEHRRLAEEQLRRLREVQTEPPSMPAPSIPTIFNPADIFARPVGSYEILQGDEFFPEWIETPPR